MHNFAIQLDKKMLVIIYPSPISRKLCRLIILYFQKSLFDMILSLKDQSGRLYEFSKSNNYVRLDCYLEIP